MRKFDFEEFFSVEMPSYGNYANLRSIASYVDGLKNASRKVIHTVINKNINKKQRLDITANEVVSYSKYVHGSIENVLVGMAQDYTGANNLNLLSPDGKFGNRNVPIPSASRYISTKKMPIVDSLFNKEDFDILVHQTFEGFKIEPRYYVPILPMLLINGSENPSVGFAQKILPRDPKAMKRLLIKKIKNPEKKFKVSLPSWNGFKGKVIEEEPGSYTIYGNFQRDGVNVIIDELPIGYSLKSYIKVLNTLEDDKVIKTYDDHSDPKKDTFKFIVKFDREFMKTHTDEDIFRILKLYKKVTENYTCIGEDNKIHELKSVEEVFENYFRVRMEFYKTRKEYIIHKKENDIEVIQSKFAFIKYILEGKVVVNKKSKDEIIKQIENMKFIIKVDDSYEYLLRLPIYSLTKEKINQLSEELKKRKLELKEMKETSEQDMYLDDLDKLKL